jgi:hypothetical protein
MWGRAISYLRPAIEPAAVPDGLEVRIARIEVLDQGLQPVAHSRFVGGLRPHAAFDLFSPYEGAIGVDLDDAGFGVGLPSEPEAAAESCGGRFLVAHTQDEVLPLVVVWILEVVGRQIPPVGRFIRDCSPGRV